MSDTYISMNPEMEINKIGFGFLRLPQVEDKEDKKICDWDKINKLVDRYFELGGKYIDTAYTYLDGQSEMAVKNVWLSENQGTVSSCRKNSRDTSASPMKTVRNTSRKNWSDAG